MCEALTFDTYIQISPRTVVVYLLHLPPGMDAAVSQKVYFLHVILLSPNASLRGRYVCSHMAQTHHCSQLVFTTTSEARKRRNEREEYSS